MVWVINPLYPIIIGIAIFGLMVIIMKGHMLRAIVSSGITYISISVIYFLLLFMGIQYEGLGIWAQLSIVSLLSFFSALMAVVWIKRSSNTR